MASARRALAVAAAADAFPAWAALGPSGRAEHLHRLADLIDANVDRLAEVECRRHGDAAALAQGARDRTRCAQLPRLRRSRRRVRGARVVVQRHREPGHPHAERAGRGDHPVERAVHALHLEDRAGAGRGVHRRPQAGRVVAAVVLAARRPRRRGGPPARCLQRRAGDRRGGGRSARRAPGRAADLVHRLAGDRPR